MKVNFRTVLVNTSPEEVVAVYNKEHLEEEYQITVKDIYHLWSVMSKKSVMGTEYGELVCRRWVDEKEGENWVSVGLWKGGNLFEDVSCLSLEVWSRLICNTEDWSWAEFVAHCIWEMSWD